MLFDLLYKLLHFLRFVFLQSEGVQDRFRALTFFKPKVLSTLAFDEATLGCSFFFGGMAKTRLFVGSQLSRSDEILIATSSEKIGSDGSCKIKMLIWYNWINY